MACRESYGTTWHGYKVVSQELNDTGAKRCPGRRRTGESDQGIREQGIQETDGAIF
jgi:hypothetical protein